MNRKWILFFLALVILISIFLFIFFSELERFDKFHVKKIYPTLPNGREWLSSWENKIARTLKTHDTDPYNTEMMFNGNGKIFIDGNGTATISGKSPRIYVFDKSKPKWDNVEITFYAKRLSEIEKISHQGFVAGARSEHQDVEVDPCKGKTYYGALLYDGRVGFQKEMIHDQLYSKRFPENNKLTIFNESKEVPREVWIGMKFVVFTVGNKVKLELYVDLTDGKDGGEWKKITEFLDDGKEIIFDSSKNIKNKCGHGVDKIFVDPGTSVFLRNDGIKSAEYKKFSVREILP
jgi:hypothetical protein